MFWYSSHHLLSFYLSSDRYSKNTQITLSTMMTTMTTTQPLTSPVRGFRTEITDFPETDTQLYFPLAPQQFLPTTQPPVMIPVPVSRMWNPIPRVYSPPVMVPGMRNVILWMPEDAPETLMGLFIGASGVHFKNITALTGAAYLFLLRSAETGRYYVDVWGYPGSEILAVRALSYHWKYNVEPLWTVRN